MRNVHELKYLMLSAGTTLLITACGGGSGGTSTPTTPEPIPGSNVAPSAQAGADLAATAGAAVALNGSPSSDADGSVAFWAWTQTGGTTVTLSNANTGAASFTAPANATSSPLVLTFTLTVTDDDGATDSDTVTVTIAAASTVGSGFDWLVRDINTDSGSSGISAESGLPDGLSSTSVVVGNQLYFTASDGVHNGVTDKELWATDGTFAGTRLVKDINPGGTGSMVGLTGRALNGKLVFYANNGTATGLWISDGTSNGTQLLKDVSPTASENIYGWVVAGNNLYFISNHSDYGRELWVTDGTTSGTHLVRDIVPGPNTSDIKDRYAVIGDKLFFFALAPTASAGSSAWQLWVTDGTDIGTQMLTNTTFGTAIASWDMAVLQNKVYFSHDDGSGDQELWVSDGTVSGTRLFKDVSGPNGSSWPSKLQTVGSKLVFSAYKPNEGAVHSLWASDGTDAGTTLISDVEIFVNADANLDTAQLNGKLYFRGHLPDDSTYKLWATDGTISGTSVINDADPVDHHTNRYMITAGNRIVFFANDVTHGKEPWVTDGTNAGTQLLKDVFPGVGNSPAGGLVAVGNKAYFRAATTTGDLQLFETDGTPAGTRQLAPADATNTVSPLSASGVCHALGNQVLFTADFHLKGNELYSFAITPP